MKITFCLDILSFCFGYFKVQRISGTRKEKKGKKKDKQCTRENKKSNSEYIKKKSRKKPNFGMEYNITLSSRITNNVIMNACLV